MFFYFFIWLCLFCFSILEINNLQKKDSFFVGMIITVILFILSFIRWETGTDWIGYYEYFNHIYYYCQDSDFEFGFARINEFAKLTFNSYTILLFIFSCIIFYFQTKMIFKYSPLPLFSLFFLWSISFANVFYIRQTIATMILFYSTTFLITRKPYMFFIWVYLATLFHSTSFIFILAYWVYNLKVTIKQMWIILFFSLLFSTFLLVILDNISSFLGEVIQYKLQVYMSLGEEGDSMTTTPLRDVLLRGSVNKLFVLFLLTFFSSRKVKDNSFFRGYLNLYWFGALLYFILAPISIVFVRFSFPFDIVQIILLPLLLKTVSIKNKYILYSLISLFLLFRFYVTLFSNYYELYVPYKTVFSYAS